MNRAYVPAFAVFLLFGSFYSASISADLDGIRTRLTPDDPVSVGIGFSVYAEHCAACHGKNLEGQTAADNPDPEDETWLPAPAHDETGHTWHHADDELFDVVKYGLDKAMKDPDYPMWMPAYQDVLSDEEIISVLSYIKSTWSDEYKAIHDQKNKLEETYWQPFVH